MSSYTYEAFISYRHLQLDKAVAKRLHSLIETYHIPKSVQKINGKKKMGKVFRDEEELPLATSLSDNIKAALEASRWLIVVCTPALLESRWCMFEIEYFISLGRRDRILLVLADGTAETSFPTSLCVRVVDGKTEPVEPLAANIVAESTAGSLRLLKKEKLRILAPMLGVGFDDLRRRARRRRIRLAAAAVAASLAVGAGVGVYVTINRQREEALKREAQEQARLAEEASRQAEEEKSRAEEEKIRAESERVRAEEEGRKKEEERKKAVFNDLGERMERAQAFLEKGEKRSAASTLLTALALSDENEGMRHEELIRLLKRAVYIEPFTVVSGFNNQNVRVNSIALSPSADRAIGIVNSNSVAMIDLNANEILYQVSVGNAMIADLSFSADGSRFMALCDKGRLVTVWNTEDGSEAFRYVSKKNEQYQIANAFFWTDEKTLFVQDMNEFYLVREDGTRTLFYTLGGQMEGYSPDNNLISRVIGRPIGEVLTITAEDYSGMEVKLSPDCSKVLIAGMDGSTAMTVLDAEGKKISLLGVPADDACYMPGVLTERWTLSPDGKTAVCSSYFGFVGGWDTESGALLFLDGFDVNDGFEHSSVAFSADSSRIAYTAENMLYVADARTGKWQVKAEIDSTSFVPELAFTGDGEYLLMTNQSMFIINAGDWSLELLENAESGAQYNNIIPLKDSFLITRYDGTASFYSMPSLASVEKRDAFEGELSDPPPAWGPIEAPLKGEHELTEGYMQSMGITNPAPSMYFSRDLKTVALGYADGVIELFDADGDGTVKAMVGELSSRLEAVAMSERYLIASDQSRRLLIYDLLTLETKAIVNAGVCYAAFAFSGDGSLFMAMYPERDRIDVYEVESGTRLFGLPAGEGTFADMSFSRDGAYAVGLLKEGGAVCGTLFADENELIRQAKRLTKLE